MSGILGRTVFLDKLRSGQYVMHDWALVTTGLGTCVEPCRAFSKEADKAISHDPTDMLARVDNVESLSIGRENCLIGGADSDGSAMHGGVLWPRVGY